MAALGSVNITCPLGCGIDIPVPVTLATDDDAPGPELTVWVGIPPVFDQQVEWHMRRFHGGKDDLPTAEAA